MQIFPTLGSRTSMVLKIMDSKSKSHKTFSKNLVNVVLNQWWNVSQTL